MFDLFKNLKSKSTLSEMNPKRSYSKAELDTLALLIKNNSVRQSAFESVYGEVESKLETHNLVQQNAQKQIEKSDKLVDLTSETEEVVTKIVDELVSQTVIWDSELGDVLALPTPIQHYGKEVAPNLEKQLGVQLTGYLAKQDVPEPSGKTLLSLYKRYIETGNMHLYHTFHQGLDILDIDEVLYRLLHLDPNAMSNWLLPIKQVVDKTRFFKIPKTRIIKVPLTLLQSTRVYEFQDLNPLSFEIINQYAQKVFDLDLDKDYFIKTGTFSSKFDFRNAKVTKGQEVSELGSYLWFIQHQASQFASPLNNQVVYGVSSNNEWVVREFIEDKEDNPTIYNGLPLHTEYRVFVDFDTEEIIGISPYWEPSVMKEHFLELGSLNVVQKQHDYINYINHEETLMKRYEENK